VDFTFGERANCKNHNLAANGIELWFAAAGKYQSSRNSDGKKVTADKLRETEWHRFHRERI
jgi:hypothetical protein